MDVSRSFLFFIGFTLFIYYIKNGILYVITITALFNIWKYIYYHKYYSCTILVNANIYSKFKIYTNISQFNNCSSTFWSSILLCDLWNNFAGRGQILSIGFDVGTQISVYNSYGEPGKYESFNLRFVDPMFNDTPNRVGFSLFYQFHPYFHSLIFKY